MRILTHCNTGPLACGQFGTALGVVQAAANAGREIHVYVDETRPYLQGARLTAWELEQAGSPLHAHRRRGRRIPARLGQDRRGPRRGRPGRRQRRHGQQDRDLPARGAGRPPPRAVLRLRAAQLGRPRDAGRRRHPDRGAPGRPRSSSSAASGSRRPARRPGTRPSTSPRRRSSRPSSPRRARSSRRSGPRSGRPSRPSAPGTRRRPPATDRAAGCDAAAGAGRRRPRRTRRPADGDRGDPGPARRDRRPDDDRPGRSCATSSSATGCSPPTRSATSTTASSPGPAGAARSRATSWSRSPSSTPACRPSRCSSWAPTRARRAILRDVIRPRAAYVAALSETLPAVAGSYRIDPGPQMVRMWVDRTTFRPYPSEVRRLLPVEIGDLNRLYQLGFASWLPSSAIADGVYYGMRVGGRLVAAAGTHVISHEARLAVVGNVLTHVDFRGRGFATATTGAVTADLLRTCDQVVLNVRVRQPARAPGVSPARLPGARPVRGAARPPPRLALAGPARPAAPVPVHHQGDPAPMTDHDEPSAARRHRPRPGRGGRPADRMGRARDARPAAHPRAVRAGAAARAGLRIGACLHVTTETANLMRTLKAGGAEVVARGLEPALDEGRRRGRARRRVRDRLLRPARRGPGDLLRATSRRRRHATRS